MSDRFTLSTGITVDIISAHIDYGAENVLNDLKEILPKHNLFIGDTGCDCDNVYYITHREITASELLELNKKIFE